MKYFFGLMFLAALACLALAQTAETFNPYLRLPVFEGSTLVNMT